MGETAKYAVLSVMGPHAGEEEEEIFLRKRTDIIKCGQTFWLIRSHSAKPDMVQSLCLAAAKAGCTPVCLFVEPSTHGGAVPTKSSRAASEYSPDLTTWQHLPVGLSPVTGHITPGVCALVFDHLMIDEAKRIDLWDYSDFFDSKQPVIFRQGVSTVCGVAGNTRSNPRRMKSNVRRVVAVGVLKKPYAVWLR